MTVVPLVAGQYFVAGIGALFDAGQIVGLRFALFHIAHTGGAHPLGSSAVGTIDSLALAVQQSVPVVAVAIGALPPVAEDIVLLPPAGGAAQPAAAEKAAHYAAAPWQKVSWKQLMIQALVQWVGQAGGCGNVGFGLPQDLSLPPPHSPPSRRPHPVASRCG